MAGTHELTDRQRRILDHIRSMVRSRGYPPSIRELGEAVGLKSPSSVHSQLATLERAGYLRRDPTRPRAIEVQSLYADDGESSAWSPDQDTQRVPLVGDIAAGAPILAEEQVADELALPRRIVGEGTLFLLQVRGESMVEAGVLPGDYVVIRQQPTVEQGEMCAALIDGEATVKFFRRTKAGEVFLDPANEAYEPVAVPSDGDTAVLGKVTAVLRSL